MATNKEILKELQLINDNLPNGELALIQVDIASLKEDQKAVREGMRELKKQMLDPDNGVIARVNRNSDFREDAKIKLEDIGDVTSEVMSIKLWRHAVNKALWIMFASVIGLVLKALFIT